MTDISSSLRIKFWNILNNVNIYNFCARKFYQRFMNDVNIFVTVKNLVSLWSIDFSVQNKSIE